MKPKKHLIPEHRCPDPQPSHRTGGGRDCECADCAPGRIVEELEASTQAEREAERAMDELGDKRLVEEVDEANLTEATKQYRRRLEKVADVDPWAHRAKNMRCRTCMFFVPKPTQGIKVNDGCLDRLGRCRKHAPTMTGYPAVYSNDWCGDHKLDENKL